MQVNGYEIRPGAKLEDANFKGADPKRAEASQDTHWPEGFDPEAAGVTFE